MTENTWRKYLTDYNEGLGLVYERFVLNDFLERLRRQYGINSVLEAPLYGMAGVSGINDVILARNGVSVTMVDDTPERVEGVQRIWRDDLRLPAEILCIDPGAWGNLPLASKSFDLTWEWAGLWYIADPAGLLRELVRTSRNLVFVAMPNNIQVGYWMRKLVIDRDFFAEHDERWTDIGLIRRLLEAEGVQRIWRDDLRLPAEVICIDPGAWGNLPLASNSFDLTWEWAGLWYIADPAGLLRELVRTSRNLVFVAMPNNIQVGYWMRKLVIDREFFAEHDESWTDIGRIRRLLEAEGVQIIEEGVLDVPPWPDTVMPANEVLKRLGIRSQALEEQFTGDGWQWSTMAYYLGDEPDLRERVMKYAWLDHAPLPWQVKSIWAHHRYLVGRVPG